MNQVPQPARHQWRGFLEILTTKRTGQAVSVQFVSAERDSRLVADKDPLSHITYFERDDVLVVCVTSAGADHGGREHIIEHPHKIIVDASSPSTVRKIDIQGADGARTQITLHDNPGC